MRVFFLGGSLSESVDKAGKPPLNDDTEADY
jgi:hypothetical protein